MRLDNLFLYGRQNDSAPLRINLTSIAQDWARSTAAIGGYKLGTFNLTTEQVSRAELEDAYAKWIGCVVKEHTAGIESWSGIICELRLAKNGQEFLVSLDPDWFHNSVSVFYTDSNGQQQKIGYVTNDDSIAIFGRMEYILVFGGGAATPMAYAQATHLTEFGWPRSRMVGTIQAGGGVSTGTMLQVTVAGWWSTLNWRYYSTSYTAQASTLMGVLQAASEWVLDGRRETNAMTVYVDCQTPQRLGDLMKDIIEQGDSSGNVWQAGVYAGRKLIYEQAPTTVGYYLRNGVLVDKAGGEVIPSLLLPGFLLQNAEAPAGIQPPGDSDVWDRPDVAYVEALEYAAPDVLRLQLQGQEEAIQVMTARQRNIERASQST